MLIKIKIYNIIININKKINNNNKICIEVLK